MQGKYAAAWAAEGAAIECRNLVTHPCGSKTCGLIDGPAGRPIDNHPSACLYCIKTHPLPETRWESGPVASGLARAAAERRQTLVMDRAAPCKHIGEFLRVNSANRSCNRCAIFECKAGRGEDGEVRMDTHCLNCDLYEASREATDFDKAQAAKADAAVKEANARAAKPKAAKPADGPPAGTVARVEGVQTTLSTSGGFVSVKRNFGDLGRIAQDAKKLILRHDCPPGDIVAMTAAVRDLSKSYPGRWQIDVRTPQGTPVWENNPRIKAIADDDPEAVTLTLDWGPTVNRCNQTGRHLVDGFIDSLERALQVRITKTRTHGELWMRPEDAEPFDNLPPGFWLIISGGKRDFTVKHPVPATLQAVVDHFFDKGIPFVQVGSAGDIHPRLENVVDLVGKTSLRDLIKLAYYAGGIITPVTFLMHAAAALPQPQDGRAKPCVVIAGGREPRSFFGYNTHRILDSVGTLPCCATRSCWKNRTVPLGDKNEVPGQMCLSVIDSYPECMQRIAPADVIRAVESYL